MNTKLAFALLAAALVAAGRSKETPKPEQKTGAAPAGDAVEIKIGHVAPLTGGNAHLGKDNENGARLAVEEANAASIKIGGKTAKFTLVAEDDQEDPKVGATVAQKLVDAKVAGGGGGPDPRPPRPPSPILHQARPPAVSGSPPNPQLPPHGGTN